MGQSSSTEKEVLDSGVNWTTTIHNDTYPFISPTQLNLAGKAIFITGASKGIGRQLALSYARAGASRIAIGARSPLDELAAEIAAAATDAGHAAPTVVAVPLDVCDKASVEAAVSTISRAFDGQLDILINNAGYLAPFTPIADSDPDAWWRTWEVNIKGPYLVSRAALPLLLASPSGAKTIIGLSSAGAHHVMSGASAYQTTKLALLRFTEFFNAEYAAQGLVAYCVHPGGVPTELAWGMPQAFAEKILVDTPELAADAMVWLSSERREWLRGRYVSCTWDMEELLSRRAEIEEKNLLKVRMRVV
ncbi:oxidoreductase-like protein [Phyllosticta capitalensis]|uniref:oxidoreductase-like protein n=1 Tax=Phyllosticta capitalensis TaxID=121624 RepID=UPI00313251D7